MFGGEPRDPGMLGEESCLVCLVWTREASLTQLLVRDAKDFGWTFESLGATRDAMAWLKDMVGHWEKFGTHTCAHIKGTTAGQEATLMGCGRSPQTVSYGTTAGTTRSLD